MSFFSDIRKEMGVSDKRCWCEKAASFVVAVVLFVAYMLAFTDCIQQFIGRDLMFPWLRTWNLPVGLVLLVSLIAFREWECSRDGTREAFRRKHGI